MSNDIEKKYDELIFSEVLAVCCCACENDVSLDSAFEFHVYSFVHKLIDVCNYANKHCVLENKLNPYQMISDAVSNLSKSEVS